MAPYEGEVDGKSFFVVKVRWYKDVIVGVPGIRAFVHIILFPYALVKNRERSAKFYRCISPFFNDPKDSIEKREKTRRKKKTDSVYEYRIKLTKNPIDSR